MPDFVLGLILNGLVAVFLWILTYFGYITLGLPQHFDYQTLDRQIQSAIPRGYVYSTTAINNFRGPNTQTLMVVAHSQKYDKNNYADKPNGQELSDILLFFDKTANSYKMSYEYKPVQHVAGSNGEYDALVTNPVYFDTHFVTPQGKNAILTGWIYIGADASEPIPILFSDYGGRIVVSSLDPAKAPFDQKTKVFKVSNYYAPKQVTPVTEIDGFYTKKSQIAFRYIKDFVCKACGDENTYQLFYYEVNNGKLIYDYPEPQNFVGLQSINKFLSGNGYSID